MFEIDKDEFSKIISANWTELHLLKLRYMAAQLREQELKEMFDAVDVEVLQENEFFAPDDVSVKRYGLKPGDRLLERGTQYLLGDDDFEKFISLTGEKKFALGYIDKDGTYKEDYSGAALREAEREMVMFFINLLPKSFQDKFIPAMKNRTHRNRLIELIMGYKEDTGQRLYAVKEGQNLLMDRNYHIMSLDGKDIYSDKTVEDYIAQGLTILNTKRFDELWEKHRVEYRAEVCGKWKEIAEARYEDMLDALPPLEWSNGGFFFSEFFNDDVTSFYQKWRGKYYASLQVFQRPRQEILEELQACIANGTITQDGSEDY